MMDFPPGKSQTKNIKNKMALEVSIWFKIIVNESVQEILMVNSCLHAKNIEH